MAENFAAEQQQWADLCKELRERQEAGLRCQLFEHGMFVRGRVPEWQRARAAVGDTRRRMDEFIAQLESR